MNELKVTIPGFDGASFTFISPLELKLEEKFPQKAFDENGGEISLVEFNAKADKNFSIKGGEDIEFGIEGGGFAAFGVYQSSEKLKAALAAEELNEQLMNLLNLTIRENENLFALRWGYDFGASLNGKVGLFSAANPVKLDFGVKAGTTGKSYLLHSFDRELQVGKAITQALATWKTPYQVESFDSLKPKTTVVFETMGNLDISLGVEYGYNFNWVREAVKFGGLSGDLGMKIEAGIKAKFGFSAVGNYALAITRESDAKTLRAQVFKMKQHGWAFSLDGGVSGQYEGNIIPEKLDDFVKGIFNLNGLQVLKDFEKWTSESNKIEDLLGEKLDEYTIKFIEKVTGIDVGDVEQKLKDAIDVLKSLVKKWHELPHEINSYLYGLLGKAVTKAELDEELKLLKDVLDNVVKFGEDPTALSELIEEQLRDIEFFTKPFGKWLSAYSTEGAVSLLANLQKKTESRKIAGIAKKTIGFIDGSELAKQLKRLQEEIDEKLNLKVIEELDVDKWHAWLIERLKKFLGVKQISDELEKVKKAINETRKRADDFYKMGYAALTKKYSFDFHYAFQKTTGNSALIDVTLDFSEGNQAEAAEFLKQILGGDFKTVLTTTETNCLKLNQAVLTHEIKRNTHLGVNVPYFTVTMDHITNSVAQGKFVDSADGKLWVYNLQAEDIVKKRKSLSRLAINVELTEKAGIRKFSEENNRIDYSFYFGGKEIKRRFIERRFKFAADRYLNSAFPPGTKDFSAYLTTTDEFLDKNGYPDTDDFGTVLMDLKVSMPGNVMSFWENVPKPGNTDFYKNMSELIQSTLREWIPLNFIQGAREYQKRDLMFPLLAYASLSLKTEKKFEDGVFYWEAGNDSKRAAEFNSVAFREKLRGKLATALSDSGDSNYKESNIVNILNFVLNNINGKKAFLDLCDLEKDIIGGVVKTAKAFHKFNDQSENDPEKKARFLAEFGAAFADTFNDEFGLNPAVQTDYTPRGSLRPLGLTMFLKIIKLLTPEFDETKFAAMFELFVLDPELSEQDFKKFRDEFLKGEFDEREKKFTLRQRIVNVTGLPM
jgi:hypothetical protein